MTEIRDASAQAEQITLRVFFCYDSDKNLLEAICEKVLTLERTFCFKHLLFLTL
jgi:hypothetical protein